MTKFFQRSTMAFSVGLLLQVQVGWTVQAGQEVPEEETPIVLETETQQSGDGAAAPIPEIDAILKKPAAPQNLKAVDGPLPGLPLLAFVDERTMARHGVLLREWAAEVAKEGVFNPEWMVRPRVENWTSPNRAAAVRSILTEIQTRKPSAVMLWGAVGWMATGTYDPDGHGPRAAWTDVPFASDHTTWTDTKNFTVTYPVDYAKNIPGDGKYDQKFEIVAGIRAKRSVGRVDFSNMTSSSAVSNVDEDDALEDYLRRNLAYRRGQGFANEVVFLSSILNASSKDWIKQNIVGRTVKELGGITAGQTYPIAGKRVFGMYTSIVPYMRDGFRDTSGNMASLMWVVLYKSYGGDPWNVAETGRQYLRQSLVVTWGGRHWMPNGETVHEAFMRHSYPGKGVLVAEDTLLGDVTLKLK